MPSAQYGINSDCSPFAASGETIIVGEAVQLPLRTLIDAPTKDRRPDSHDPLIYDPQAEQGWNRA